jgi:Flp pilus assembly pilin Flp
VEQLLTNESGQSMAEYALIGAFIFLAVVGILEGLGISIANKLDLLKEGLK